MNHTQHRTEKLIIIGSGPAGLTAALYAARAGLKPLVLQGTAPGGQLMGTTAVENWPGEKSILGPTLMLQIQDHALHVGAQLIHETVREATLTQQPFMLSTEKQKYSAQSIIIATGATPRKLGCPGENEYWGRGVTTCAVCDGALYKNKRVLVVGGGDTAMENASFLTNFTDAITLVHILPQFTASLPMQQRVLNNPKITSIYSSTVTAIGGDREHVTHVTITNQETGKEQVLPVDGIFLAIGLVPNTHLFKNQLDLTNYGYIKLYSATATSVPGIFAAGDVADARYRQAITSAGSGCAAALDAERYLKQQE